jgi:two-component system, OmpR family, response regulator
MILHVEDDRSLRNLVAVTLEGLGGYQVRTAVDGYEALALAREATPSLVLLDRDLPGLDGVSTLRELRGIERLRDVPVIFLTATSDAAEMARLRAEGVVEVLGKPFRPRQLVQSVERALGGGRGRAGRP